MDTDTREHSNGWCCTDCLVLLANGETPIEMDARETAEYLARVDHYCEGAEVTLGRMLGEDECEHDDACSEDHAESCEQVTFSWSRCDVCGSNLGGSRNAVTFWLT